MTIIKKIKTHLYLMILFLNVVLAKMVSPIKKRRDGCPRGSFSLGHYSTEKIEKNQTSLKCIEIKKEI